MKKTLNRSRGAALVTALVLLVVITILALAATRTSTFELRMAGNNEDRAVAAQVAMGIAEAVTANPASTPVVGVVGTRICLGPRPTDLAPCGLIGQLSLPVEAEPQCVNCSRFVSVERLGSETRPPPRGVGSSLTQFGAAQFRIHARFNDERGNRADSYEGVLVLVPRSGTN